jgi:hypothetical protein
MLVEVFSCPSLGFVKLYEGKEDRKGYKHIVAVHSAKSKDASKSKFITGAKILHLIRCTLRAGRLYVCNGNIAIFKLQTPFIVGRSRETNEPCTVVNVVVDLMERRVRTAYPAKGDSVLIVI